ncbi:hypothetical protein Tfer_0037 [Thermincola ferriacetica]|uniref:Peptidase M10 metallopeptidase domain-containing protein n=1 Tax=Thermincola ferriacetica TaxID=281456 RepID=A0A0L6W6H5_9FIRM|nr:hypothetical protein [Thermincola ferriacetica]KNZ70968.1 hypothetical protein Tfer_0037 [Thermincola ferriacetica]
MIKKKAKIFIFTLVFLFGIVSIAEAYFLLGTKWGSSSVTYRRDASMNWVDTCTAAGNSWSSDVTMKENSASKYVIYKISDSAKQWSGETNISTAYGITTSATTKINSYVMSNYTWTQKQSVIAHEMGHSLGLADNNGYLLFEKPEYICLMIGYDYWRNKLGVYTPKTDDRAGVNYLY